MEKNVIIAKHLFETQLIGLINNSGLPVYIIEPIIKNIYSDVSKLYMKSLKEEYEKVKGGDSSDEVHVEGEV